MSIVMVVGSPGAGKTTITDAARRKGIRTIQIGTLIEEEAVRKHYVKSRDRIRHDLSFGLQQELQRHAFSKISKMKGKMVVDTHMSVQHNNRYIPGIPYKLIRLLEGVAAWVYIDADTEDILRRRRGDRTRKKDIVSRHDIEMQRTMNLSLLFYCAWYVGSPVYIIYNKEGKVGESVRQFRNILSETFGA